MKLIKPLVMLACLLAVVEGVLLLATARNYYWQDRQLYFSRDAFRTTEMPGLWTFTPATEIAEAAVYTRPGNNPRIEYLCRFRTNSLGLVDTNWSEGQKINYLVLGDSFTQGAGGCPWLTRDTLPVTGPTVVNGVLQGVGLQSYQLLEQWLNARVEIDRVILIFSGQSFARDLPRQFWDDSNRNGPFLWYIDPHISAEALLTLAEDRLERFPPGKDQGKPFWQRQINYLAGFVTALDDDGWVFNPEEEARFQRNKLALQALTAKYPHMKVILVPEKHETGFARTRDRFTERVEALLSRLGVHYRRCTLGRADFLPLDGHPNVGGYKKLRECLWREF